ncbi:MAG TPA: hypothetical protein DIT97_05870 [Gimesia maris]|uniref:Uncharacterized protein n=1 Tax=Gimesia maris TaxID=122 RepID=A0A3D3R1G2_9PLAN|nr:hypothetical protein [Gimesia maris]
MSDAGRIDFSTEIMLVLIRKVQQSIRIDDTIIITVVHVKNV